MVDPGDQAVDRRVGVVERGVAGDVGVGDGRHGALGSALRLDLAAGKAAFAGLLDPVVIAVVVDPDRQPGLERVAHAHLAVAGQVGVLRHRDGDRHRLVRRGVVAGTGGDGGAVRAGQQVAEGGRPARDGGAGGPALAGQRDGPALHGGFTRVGDQVAVLVVVGPHREVGELHLAEVGPLGRSCLAGRQPHRGRRGGREVGRSRDDDVVRPLGHLEHDLPASVGPAGLQLRSGGPVPVAEVQSHRDVRERLLVVAAQPVAIGVVVDVRGHRALAQRLDR